MGLHRHPSGYGPGTVIVPAAAINPALTQPVDGTVWTSDTLTALWAVAEQTAYTVRLYRMFDDFARTVSGGWGVGTQGQSYTIVTGTSADMSVAAGVATLSLSAVNSVRRGRTDVQTDTDEVSVEFQVPVAAAGASIRVDLIMGFVDSNNYHRAQVAIFPAGNVDAFIIRMVAGVQTTIVSQASVIAAHSTTRWYGLRFKHLGPNLQLKLWDTAGPEPDAWDLITGAAAPPPGGVGLQAFLTTGNTNVLPVAVRFRRFTRGVADLVYDSRDRGFADVREVVLPYSLPDLSSWKLELQTKNAKTLRSDVASAVFTVDYLEPPAPDLTVTAVPDAGAIRVAITNPAPAGSQPSTASQDLYRRPVAGPNMIANGSFETDLAGWQGNDAIVARADTFYHDGGWSARITPDGVGTAPRLEMLSAAAVPVTEGQAVTVDGWMRLNATSNFPIQLRLNWYDAAGAYVSTTQPAPVQAVPSTWQPLSLTAIVPAGITKVGVRAEITGGATAPATTDTARVDQVRLRVSDDSGGIRVAAGLPAGAVFDDKTAVSGVDYEYRARVFGTNGTRVDGIWT